jgi:hypothetical protein
MPAASAGVLSLPVAAEVLADVDFVAEVARHLVTTPGELSISIGAGLAQAWAVRTPP